MKKIICLIFILTLSNVGNAQKLSYGPLVGAEYYDCANAGGLNTFHSKTSFVSNLGGYLEYSLSNKFGLKTEITFNKKEITYTFNGPLGEINTDFQLSLFEIAPSFKYDMGVEYRKGFYMLLGPKISIITKATSEGDDAKDAFKVTRIGLQYGVGSRVAKYIDVQAKLDYEITEFKDFENGNKSHFIGMYLSLNVDLERIINSSNL
jgi:hypothetical protein